MSRRCNHKFSTGKTAIIDGVCQICSEEFGAHFLKKQRDKVKRKKKPSSKFETEEGE